MGSDYYESAAEKDDNRRKNIPDIGIGGGSIIRQAIIDKNARIGSNCRIGIDTLVRQEGEYSTHYIVDGIIVIPKNQIVPDGTVI